MDEVTEGEEGEVAEALIVAPLGIGTIKSTRILQQTICR